MILTTERLILRPFEESDAASVYEYAKDERVGPITGWPVHTSMENSRDIIRNVLAVPETYAVCLKEDNQAIGSISLMIGPLSHLCLPDTDAEIGYWLGVPFWGRGLIPEALRELMRHAFADLHLEALWCGYYEGNLKSRRVMEKCGFVPHHTNENVHLKLMDETRTEHLYRLSKQDWKRNFVMRRLKEDEIPAALDLAWQVFQEFESPDYGEEGTAEFRKCLNDPEYLADMEYYGTFDGSRLVGEIAIKPERNHICFFFTEGKYHRLGIGRNLFGYLLEQNDAAVFTLNSSPYGLPFYKAIGFIETDKEQTVHGITFTPMVYQRKKAEQ